MKGGYFLAALASAIMIAAVVASVVVNPPGEVRKRGLDTVRTQDLNMMRTWIQTYKDQNHELPPDLATLEKSNASVKSRAHDPETGEPYTYEVTGEKSYQLCAVFSRTSGQETPCCSPYQMGSHDAGKFCYPLTVQ